MRSPIFKGIIEFAAGTYIWEKITGLGKKLLFNGLDLAKGELKKQFLENRATTDERAELWEAIIELGPQKSQSFFDELKKSLQKSGVLSSHVLENDWNKSLAKMIRHKPDGSLDLERSERIMSKVSQLSPENLDLLIRAITDDALLQRAHHIYSHSHDYAESVIGAIVEGAATAYGAADELANRLAERVERHQPPAIVRWLSRFSG